MSRLTRMLMVAAVVMVAVRADAHTHSAECYMQLQTAPSADSDGLLQRACDGRCAFSVRICTNMPDGSPCQRRSIDRIRVGIRHRGVMTLPALGEREPACGAPTLFTLRENEGRAATAVFRALARAGSRWDRDRLVVRCLPNPTNEGCPARPAIFPPDDAGLPGCREVAAESAYCLTVSSATPALLGLDSGRVCPLIDTDAPLAAIAGDSIGWIGHRLFACDEDQGLLAVSLLDGSWEALRVPCDGVVADSTRLLLLDADGAATNVRVYANPEAVRRGRVDFVIPVAHGAVLAAGFGRLLEAPTAGGSVRVTDLATGSVAAPLVLDGYPGPMFGMSEAADRTLVVSGGTAGDTVYGFDARTGSRVCHVTPERSVRGLACVSRRPVPWACPVSCDTGICWERPTSGGAL